MFWRTAFWNLPMPCEFPLMSGFLNADPDPDIGWPLPLRVITRSGFGDITGDVRSCTGITSWSSSSSLSSCASICSRHAISF